MLRLLLLALFCFPALSWAGTEHDARSELSSTMTAIKNSGERQRQLDEKQEKIERELDNLREKTVDLAKESSDIEHTLSTAEEKLTILEEQKEAKEHALSERREELSSLVSAMIKLQALPPAAVVAMPGKLDETFATARALGVVTHTIEEDAESLRAQLDEIRELKSKIEKNRDLILAKKAELAEKHETLSGKIKARDALQARLETQSEEEKSELALLQTRSRNLQDLVDALDKNQQNARTQRERGIAARHVTAHHDSREIRSFTVARGKMQMPASGKIVRRYNEGSQESAFSRGITIETRENANVVTPFDGEVVYAGNFRDYGRIVIIRHSDDYHTLLSGMGHIDCTPGQFVMKGEPIGVMGADTRRLYMEVRKSGKPVDPLPWIKPVS